MNKNFKITILALLTIICAACKNNPSPAPVPPQIVPAVEVKRPDAPKHVLGIIGAVEPVYVLPMKSPFLARIDTGAENSSLDVQNLRYFERDGEKWVSFELVNDQNGEKHLFEKKILRFVTIKRINESEKRASVLMDIKFGGQIIKEKFSLADR